MIYAIISDVHSNIEAFDAVLRRCADERVDRFISLGDVVGYNANPVECIEMFRKLDVCFHVRGNHDEYVGNDAALSGFNPLATKSILWTRAQLNREQRAWLLNKKLKIVALKEGFTIVHSTLDSAEAWGYIFDIHNASDNFIYQMTPVSFCGHSHIPALFIRKPDVTNEKGQIEQYLPWETISYETSEISVKLDKKLKYLINVGSVGQPRNNDTRASFCIYDTRTRLLRRICVEYDIKAAQDKILSAGLPEALAYRLGVGK